MIVGRKEMREVWRQKESKRNYYVICYYVI